MTEASTRTGVVTVGSTTLQLPEQEARTLFLALGVAAKRGAPIAISPDTTVFVNQFTQVSLTIVGGFALEYNPEADIKRLARTQSSRLTVL